MSVCPSQLDFRSLTSKGREGREKEREGKGGEGKGKVGEGKGKVAEGKTGNGGRGN